MADASSFDDHATVADLLRLCDAYPDLRVELLDGELVMMTGSTKSHNRITNNIFLALNGPARARGCEVYTTDILVRRREVDDFAAAPDVFVRCGPPAPEDDDRTVSDPVVIFEVLSPTSERRDRTQKLLNYQAIATLQAYVLVSQREPRLEPWRRQGGVLRPGPAAHGRDAVLALPELETELALTTVYDGIEIG